MQEILLNLVAAAPPPQTPAVPSGNNNPAGGSGPSFGDVLASRMRDRDSSHKDESAADPAQDLQAQSTAAAVAAQQQQTQPAQQDPTANAGNDETAAAAATVAVVDEQASTQTALQSAINAVLEEMAASQTADPTAGQPGADALANDPQTQAAPVASFTDTLAQINAQTDTATAATPVTIEPAAVATTAVPAAEIAQQNSAVSTDQTPKAESVSASTTVAQAAADAAKEAQTAAAPVTETQSKSDANMRPSVAADKKAEKGSAAEAASSAAAVAAAKSATTVYESKSIDPARLAEGHSVSLTQQVSQGIETMARNGQNTLRMQLNPPDLGRVDLRLTSTSEGVRVAITADSASTGKLLERNLEDLKQALSNAGVTVLGLSVGQGNTAQQNANHYADAKEGPVFAASVIPSVDSEEAGAESSAGGRGLSSSYIDYRI
jgi:flagellar hook-length control protein FliK